MKFALIDCGVTRLANEPGLRAILRHLGPVPNLQLLQVASALEELGVEVKYCDLAAMGWSPARLAQELRAFSPDIIGLSVYTSHFHNAADWSAYFKDCCPEAKIMLGGSHLNAFPSETLQYITAADFACVGEAETMLPEFVKRWRSHASFENVKGLVWRAEGRIIFNGPSDLVKDLDSVPLPARHLIPNEKYFYFLSTRRNYTIALTSRGCPFNCIFCEAQHQWRGRSAMHVAQEFEQCYSRYGIHEMDLYDSNFTLNSRRVLDVCRELIARGLHKKIVWSARSRIDTIDVEMLDALREAGCYRIFYGIESGSPEILVKLRKNVNLGMAERVIRQTNKAGLETFGYFLVGSPGETRQTVAQTMKFVKNLPFDFAVFNCLTAYPGTELYEKYYLPATGLDFWREYLSKPKVEVEMEFMGRPWTELSNAEVRQLAYAAVVEYYLRPVQIWRVLRTIKSFGQIKRYLAAVWDVVWTFLLARVKRAAKAEKEL